MSWGRQTINIRVDDDYIDDAVKSWIPLWNVDIAAPSFGYAVTIHRALSTRRFMQNAAAYDMGVEHDYRTCDFKVMLTQEQVRELTHRAIKTDNIINTNKFIMTLKKGSGFFPAGADKGDSGEFKFSFIENINVSAMKVNPFGFFDVTLKIKFYDLPPSRALGWWCDDDMWDDDDVWLDYAPPDTYGGRFSLGDVGGLRDPQISARQEFSARHVTSVGGETYTTWRETDEFTSALTIRSSTLKMAELAMFVSNDRGEDFIVTPGINYYLWGGQDDTKLQGERVRILDKNITMTHSGYDLWSMPLQLWKNVRVR